MSEVLLSLLERAPARWRSRLLTLLVDILPEPLEPRFFHILTTLEAIPEPLSWLTANVARGCARGLAWRAYLQQSLRGGQEQGREVLVDALHRQESQPKAEARGSLLSYVVVDFSDASKLRARPLLRNFPSQRQRKQQLLANGSILFTPARKLGCPPLSWGHPTVWASFPGLEVWRTTVHAVLSQGQREAAVVVRRREAVPLPGACAEWLEFVLRELRRCNKELARNREGAAAIIPLVKALLADSTFMSVRRARDCVEWFDEWTEAWAASAKTKLKRAHVREKKRCKEQGLPSPPSIDLDSIAVKEDPVVAIVRRLAASVKAELQSIRKRLARVPVAESSAGMVAECALLVKLSVE